MIIWYDMSKTYGKLFFGAWDILKLGRIKIKLEIFIGIRNIFIIKFLYAYW
jgi:hypothetical protein